MKSKKIVFFMILTVCMTTTAFGQRNLGDRNFQRKDRLNREWTTRADRPANRLDQLLTEEQKTAVKEMRLNCAKETNPLTYKLRELKAKHRTLMNEEKPNQKAINSNIDEMTKLENQIAKIKAKTQVDVLSKLTDEQKLLFPREGQGKRGGLASGRMGRNCLFLN